MLFRSGETYWQYQPVPYDITFQMSVMTRNAQDGTRIVEQIIPNFTPEWTPTVELVPDVGAVYDIPIVLNNVVLNDNYEGTFLERRMVIWDLTFTMRGYLFGPTRGKGSNDGAGGGVIKFADIGVISVAEIGRAHV